MNDATDPLLILSVEDADVQFMEDPLFVAIKLTESLYGRLKSAVGLCKDHRLSQVSFHHEGVPPFWDETPESRIAGFVTEFVEWNVAGGCASAVLWARLPTGDGGYSEVSRLAASWLVNIDELKALRRKGGVGDSPGLAFATHVEWAADDRFEVEVLARVAQLRR